MDILYRYRLATPLLLEDAWPLEGYGGVVARFERDGQAVTALTLLFKNQPIDYAPTIQRRDGPVSAELSFNSPTDKAANAIVKRFSDYINLFFTVEIKPRDVSIEFIPANDEEAERIAVPSFSMSGDPPPTRLLFSLVAQAFFAGEGVEDPSFAAHLSRTAREAFAQRQYIDAFRYSFLLFEALYSQGKSRTRDMVEAMAADADFSGLVGAIIADFQNDRMFRQAKARTLVCEYSTARAMITYLIDRRGFYFHGNLKHKNAWRPDHQDDAEALAQFAVHLAAAVANTFSSAMFAPEIGERYLANAKQQGATMAIRVQYRFLDDSALERSAQMDITVPGTVATNAMAVHVGREFLYWAETELHGCVLLGAMARDEKTGQELFRVQFDDPRKPA